MTSQRRILVIGAGASGLAAIKSCKEESLDVFCYEKAKALGGRWRYSQHQNGGRASVMKSTTCISSKEMGAYSDFPPPDDFPNYLHHTKMLEYLILYANTFDLNRHIQYETQVIRITPSLEYDRSGKWSVTSTNAFDKTELTEEFDGIMVCTGRLSEPVLPCFPNQDLFTGITLHSQSLKSITEFEDRKLLVVGSGNSAVNAAVEISAVAQQVYLSTRNGFWLFPRVGPKGLPYDMHFMRRDMHLLKHFCKNTANNQVEKYLETKLNHAAYMIKPSHRATDKHPIINDDLPDKILTGRVIIKGQISRFEKAGVIFEYEDCVTDIDCVIFATGYTTKFSFLDCDIYTKENGESNLYKGVFPVQMKHPTLAFIGFVESNGPQIPVSESQTRWVSRIFCKKAEFPKKEIVENYMVSLSKRHPNDLTIDYITYMDDLAEEYGVKPNISSLIFKDTTLFWACFAGPFLPYQYRLVGPNHLNNARDFILECPKRVKQSFNTRNLCKDYNICK